MNRAWLLVLALAPSVATQVSAQEPASSLASPVRATPPRPLTDIEKLLGRPANTELLWRVTERDLDYGLIDEAKKHLAQLLAREDLSPAKVLELREKYGPGLLIRAQRDPELAKMAQPIFNMLKTGFEARSRDPEVIRHWVGKLDESASERVYAMEQLAQSGPYVIPHFLEAIKEHRLDPQALVWGLTHLPATAWPAAAATIDSGDEGIISLMLDFLATTQEPRAAEWIYFVAGNPEMSQQLRDRARATIARLTRRNTSQLPAPVRSLVQVAQRYTDDFGGLGLPMDVVTVWQWTGETVEPVDMTVPRAAEFLGLRAIRQALSLAPEDHEAKLVFLELSLDTATDRVGIENPLPTAAWSANEGALAAGSDLLLEVLDRALDTGRSSVALATVRALSDTASPQIVTGDPTRPSPLMRALDFPNSRVRFEAARAALEVHPTGPMSHSGRVMETLVQALDPRTRPAVLILDGDPARVNELGRVYRELGYDPITATSGREGFRRAIESGLIELIVVDSEIQKDNLLETLKTFSADARTSGTAVVVVAREELSPDLMESLDRLRHVAILGPITDAEKLRQALAIELPDHAIVPWSDAERRANREAALDMVVRIARGEYESMNAALATDALDKIVNDSDLGPRAAEALGFLPSPAVQERLANVALDTTLEPAVRVAAARALARNIARGTNKLQRDQLTAVLNMFQSERDPEVRRALASVVGTVDRAGLTAAPRFLKYRPGDVEPPAEEADSSSDEPAEAQEK